MTTPTCRTHCQEECALRSVVGALRHARLGTHVRRRPPVPRAYPAESRGGPGHADAALLDVGDRRGGGRFPRPRSAHEARARPPAGPNALVERAPGAEPSGPARREQRAVRRRPGTHARIGTGHPDSPPQAGNDVHGARGVRDDRWPFLASIHCCARPRAQRVISRRQHRPKQLAICAASDCSSWHQHDAGHVRDPAFVTTRCAPHTRRDTEDALTRRCRYELPSRWRRNSASMKASRLPSRTASTLPVS